MSQTIDEHQPEVPDYNQDYKGSESIKVITLVSANSSPLSFSFFQAEIQKIRDHLALLPTIEVPKWESFELITKKKGPTGPTKFECLNYYKKYHQE